MMYSFKDIKRFLWDEADRPDKARLVLTGIEFVLVTAIIVSWVV